MEDLLQLFHIGTAGHTAARMEPNWRPHCSYLGERFEDLLQLLHKETAGHTAAYMERDWQTYRSYL